MSLKEFYKEVFCLNLKDYPNFGIDLEINKLIFFVVLGLCAASVYFNVIESDIALMLKKLLRIGAVGEENAKTLSDLGLGSHKRIERLISKNIGSVRRVISVIGIRQPTYEDFIAAEKAKRENSLFSRMVKAIASRLGKNKKITEEKLNEPSDEVCDAENTQNDAVSKNSANTDAIKLYIAKEKLELAERTFSKNGSSLLKTIGSCLLLLATGLVIMLIMPTLLNFISA